MSLGHCLSHKAARKTWVRRRKLLRCDPFSWRPAKQLRYNHSHHICWNPSMNGGRSWLVRGWVKPEAPLLTRASHLDITVSKMDDRFDEVGAKVGAVGRSLKARSLGSIRRFPTPGGNTIGMLATPTSELLFTDDFLNSVGGTPSGIRLDLYVSSHASTHALILLIYF